MGLLKSVGSFFKKTTKTVGKGLVKALDTNLAVFASPITTFTRGTKAGLKKVEKMSALERSARIVGTTAVASGAVLGGGTVAGRSIVSKVIPKTFKGKVIAGVATPVAIGALSKAPKKVSKAVVKAPFELGEFGSGIAGVVTNPSVTSVKELIKDSPLLTATTAVVAGAVVTKAVAPVVGGLITKGAIENIQIPSVVSPQSGGIPPSAPVKQPTIQAMPAPVTPELVNVKKTPTTKRKRKAKKAVIRPISQRVNVIVTNRSTGTTTKNYLYGRVLA